MDMIKQILDNFRGTLPSDSATARAIDSGAPPEDIAASAAQEGLHALSGALFEALEESAARPATDLDTHVGEVIATRLREFRTQLPNDSETARAIDRNAGIEEIAELAQQEGLTSLATLLFEAEQEASRD